jgi:hypothetical protein
VADMHPEIVQLPTDGRPRCDQDTGMWSYQPCSRRATWLVPADSVRGGRFRCTQHAQNVSRYLFSRDAR